jgi:hypothetical protein
MPKERRSTPATCEPRGLRRHVAAAYVGLSPTKFDELVADGRMPAAISIDRVKVWDRFRLDIALDELADGEDAPNPWDQAS